MAKNPKPWWREDRKAWFVQIDGQRHNLGKAKKVAWRRYHELMAKPKKRTIVSVDSLLAIIDAFLGWCEKNRAPDTYEWYQTRLECFANTYPELRVADLKTFHIQEWIDGMDVAKGTKRNYGRSVKRCLRWAKKQGYIDSNPVADMELPTGGKREKMLSPAEWSTLLEHVGDESLLELLTVTWESGCRPQESLRVEARHVDLKNKRWLFSVSESKTEIPRVIYLPDEALAITRRLMLKYPKGPLFRNSRGKTWTTNAVNCAFVRLQIKLGLELLRKRCRRKHKDGRRKYLWVDDNRAKKFAKSLTPAKQSGRVKTDAQLLNEARRKLAYADAAEAGPKYCLYDLRHTWMNRLLTSGVDALTVAFLAGHSDPSTLAKVYAHLSQNPSYLLDQAKKAAG